MNIAYDTLLLGILLFIAVFGLALSLLSYRRMRNERMLVLLSIFSIFTLKGVLLSISLFWETFSFMGDTYYHTAFDVAALSVLIFLGLRE